MWFKVAVALVTLVAHVCFATSNTQFKLQQFINANVHDTPRNRALALVANMTFDEKIASVHGSPPAPYAGLIVPNTRLGIPALHLEDGPQGVADGATSVTTFPSALTVVATWNSDLYYQFGCAIGNEQRNKGVNVMLGPMMNLARNPVDGRTYESTGEDPYLSSQFVSVEIKGIQQQGVIATAKHFVNNDQEDNRNFIDANVDERTEWELYYAPFQASVNAGVGAIMYGANSVNGIHTSNNPYIINDLKGVMGFQGFGMTDWDNARNTTAAALAGLDMGMPDGSCFGQPLADLITAGVVPMSRLDDMVTRILTSMFAVGIFDNPQIGNFSADVSTPAHIALSQTIAQEASVLLRNEKNILPLNLNGKIKKIAVIGDDAHDAPIVVGCGSGQVAVENLITPLQGITTRVGSAANVSYANSQNVQGASQLAAESDVVILFLAIIGCEGTDRANLSLGDQQDTLAKAVTAANANTIVVLHIPGAVLMPWLNSTAAVIAGFYPGSQCGNSIAAILFGDASPSGRLPLSFPPSDQLVPANTPLQYPGVNNQEYYTEALLIGYRWYDAKNVTPLFPFGHGLSYTSFSYTNLQISGTIVAGNFTVTASITNTGAVAGAEVCQFYLCFPPSAGEPYKLLRGFEKVMLNPNQSETVSFHLAAQDLSIWNVTTHGWQVISGQFGFLIGSTSVDIRLRGSFQN